MVRRTCEFEQSHFAPIPRRFEWLRAFSEPLLTGSMSQTRVGPGWNGVIVNGPSAAFRRLPYGLPLKHNVHYTPYHNSRARLWGRLMIRSEACKQAAGAPKCVTHPNDHHAPGVEQNSAAKPGFLPLYYLRAKQLQSACSFLEAIQILEKGVQDALAHVAPCDAGLLRLEVPLPRVTSPLWWLQSQDHLTSTTPSIYFSPRRSSAPSTPGAVEAQSCLEGWGAVAGLGAAWTWHGKEGETLDANVFDGMNRFLSNDLPHIRVLGGTRFDCAREIAEEWAPFGSYVFILPALEMAETPDGMCLACTLAWDANAHSQKSPGLGIGRGSLEESIGEALNLIGKVSAPCAVTARPPNVETMKTKLIPDRDRWQELVLTTVAALTKVSAEVAPKSDDATTVARQEFMENGQQGLDSLLSALNLSMTESSMNPELKHKLTKVVLARKSDHRLSGALNALELLLALQERDPHAYQLCLSVPGGGWFIASTPERLYARSTSRIATEAVAGTRPRGPKGDIERDFWLGLDLLQNSKDHVEFTLVRDWLRDALDSVCSHVDLEIPKTVLKQGAVQHLYGRLSGELANGKNDADLLNILHPTPAVCGRPKDLAYSFLRENESFDRGFYAGPFGWISGRGAEFVVAIRSALVQSPEQPSQTCQGTQHHAVLLYGGVGVVRESDPEEEWNELNLKVRQYDLFLKHRTGPLDQPNINMAWAGMLVEELCRLGVNTFGVAPGSRSSPLTAAVACHPRSRIVPCIDERSLGFWALGHARSTGMPTPVITSSGTAVANLLPSVVEASMAGVPLLVLSADRPPELRDCGANQTIDQVKIFGGYTRWFQDIPAPSASIPSRMLLTTVDTAVLMATTSPRGPVHLNLQFREPLAPVQAAGSASDGDVLNSWFTSRLPYTSVLHTPTVTGIDGLSQIMSLAGKGSRALIVIGELNSQDDTYAARKVAQHLGWPVIADVLSGLRIGEDRDSTEFSRQLMFNTDHVLLDKEAAWKALRPDVVLQLGGHLTSKRLAQFLEWSSTSDRTIPMKWICAGLNNIRDDPAHLITHRIQTPFASLQPPHDNPNNAKAESDRQYIKTWRIMDDAVGQSISCELERFASSGAVVEPLVARTVSAILPPGHGLFLGNSMPIRDMDMYGSGSGRAGLVRVAANRGASGIDGVLSTATGFALGLNRPVTLIVGDISFIHDTNGLTLLRNGESFPAVTIVLINNAGGGIFSFLPIADSIPEETFNSLWATPQSVDIKGLCQSHGILHQQVVEPKELENSLRIAWGSNKHSIVEVITSRTKNLGIHQEIQRAALDTSRQLLSMIGDSGNIGYSVGDVTWHSYSLPLRKPLTTGSTENSRKGFLISLELRSTSGQCFSGIGEVAPLPGLHKESLEQVKRELGLMVQLLRDSKVPISLAMLQGGFSDWFEKEMGIRAEELSTSVRFGIEMALLVALSGACVATPLMPTLEEGKSATVQICGLVDPQGSLQNAVMEAKRCVAERFTTLKVKVARDLSPGDDARILVAIREAVGDHINLRCDANQGWSMEEAAHFFSALNGTRLEFIEEPLREYCDIPELFSRTGVPCALDETVDTVAAQSCGFQELMGVEGVVAWVVKPSLVGSMDGIAQLIRAAKRMGCKIVISSTFETSIGLSWLSILGGMADHAIGEPAAHGLGTAGWFSNDLIEHGVDAVHGSVVDVEAVHALLTTNRGSFCYNSSMVSTCPFEWANERLTSGAFVLNTLKHVNSISRGDKPVVVFLHGFMGSSSDWLPIMEFLSDDFECLAVDIPGHGESPAPETGEFTLVDVATAVLDVVKAVAAKSCIVVGYSLGARIALQMTALASKAKLVDISQAVLVSGSAGFSNQAQRHIRTQQDHQLAKSLQEQGLDSFLESWYDGPLWNGLRRCSGVFDKMLKRRRQRGGGADVNGLMLPSREQELSMALSLLSTGRMLPLDDELTVSTTQFLFISGEDDAKFCGIAKRLVKLVGGKKNVHNGTGWHPAHAIEVPGCGHAVHLENPLYVARAILSFVVSEGTQAEPSW